MKIKKKVIALLLLSVTAFSLSSCVLYNTVSDLSSSSQQTQVGDVEVNVGEIKNHDITINSTETQSEVAVAKALMCSVSIRTSAASGSGVIYSMSEDKSEAYVLTNYHVLYDSSIRRISPKINVFLYGMESYLYNDSAPSYAISAEYIGGSLKYDLALIRIKGSKVLMESCATACEFADSNKVNILETAIAVGNATGKGISATLGKINVDSENILLSAADERTDFTLRVMRTDAAVNSGNSGGGLFNSEGKLIGIVNAKSASSTADNIGYAIPSNVVKYIAENILFYCKDTNYEHVYRCMLGITVGVESLYTEYDEEKGVIYRKERVKVSGVKSASSAAYGILYSGDIINSITIDGVTYEVSRTFHVIDAMLNARVKSKVTLNVTRGSETLDLDVTFTSDDVFNADS